MRVASIVEVHPGTEDDTLLASESCRGSIVKSLGSLEWSITGYRILQSIDDHVMTEADRSERWDIHFSGQVQGVGFRYTTRSLASRFPVGGYVKNLRDGTVELVIEAEPAILRRLVSLIETEMSGYITQTQIDRSEPTGEFDSFKIAH